MEVSPSLCLSLFFVLAVPHGFLVAHMVKNLPTIQETWVQPLGQEDLLEKALAPTPVLLPGKSHGRRSLVGYSPQGHKELDMTE